MNLYNFPVIGNPSSASSRSVMIALAVIIMALLSGFGVIHLLAMGGIEGGAWIPALFTAPAIVFSLFYVVKAESKREAHYREMSALVSDAVHGSVGIDLTERDIRRMVDGEQITTSEGYPLTIIRQGHGNNRGMVLVREDEDSNNETNSIFNAREEDSTKQGDSEPTTQVLSSPQYKLSADDQSSTPDRAVGVEDNTVSKL